MLIASLGIGRLHERKQLISKGSESECEFPLLDLAWTRECHPLVAGCCDSGAMLALIFGFAFSDSNKQTSAEGRRQLRLKGPRSGKNTAEVLLSKAAALPPPICSWGGLQRPPHDPNRDAAVEREALTSYFTVLSG